MNTKDLTRNRGLLAIILGVAVFATAGGLSLAYAATDSSQNQTAPQIQGSINLQQSVLSNAKISFSTAQSTAASAVTNGKVVAGSLTVVQGSLVYDFKVVDDKNLTYSVIVDAGNGKVLYTSQGQSTNFGGFGMGGHCPMGGHGGWNSQNPSSTSPPSGTQNPTSSQPNTSYESQV